MPKGQYTRKPRKAVEAQVSALMQDAVAHREAAQPDFDRQDAAMAGEQWTDAERARFPDPAMEEIARLLISDPEKAAEIANQPPMSPLFAADRERIVKAYDAKPEAEANLSDEMKATLAEYRGAVSQPVAEPVAEPKTFDSWMAEDDVPPPANDRVSQLVRQWAGAICNGWHDVTWQLVNGGLAIEVMLITPHGTSILTEDARNWSEADIRAALECMTADLRL